MSNFNSLRQNGQGHGAYLATDIPGSKAIINLGEKPRNLFGNISTFSSSKAVSQYFMVFALVVITFIIYIPTLSNEFQLKWDDWWVVMNSYTEAGWTITNLTKIFTEFYHGQYAPINELYYLILYDLFGYDALYFHLFCLFIHILNVVLVFSLCNSILSFSFFSYKKSSLRIAFFTAMLFGIHPINVEAVSWVAASKCILFATFYILSIICYISYLKSKGFYAYLLVLLFFVLSFGSKEQAITFPAMCLLIDYLHGRNLKVISSYWDKLPLCLLALGFVIITLYSQQYNGEGVLSKQELHPWYQNIVFAAYSIVEYAIKCVLPVRLSYVYPFPNLPHESLPKFLWIYPVLLLSPLLLIDKIILHKWLFFGVVFFLIQVSVVSNIIPTSRFAIIADRYIYLGSIGVTFLLAVSFESLVKRYNSKVVFFIFGMYCLGMMGYTNQRVKVWHDSNTLKKEVIDVVRKRPEFKEWLEKETIKQKQ